MRWPVSPARFDPGAIYCERTGFRKKNAQILPTHPHDPIPIEMSQFPRIPPEAPRRPAGRPRAAATPSSHVPPSLPNLLTGRRRTVQPRLEAPPHVPVSPGNSAAA
jgi:hypothetical protein